MASRRKGESLADYIKRRNEYARKLRAKNIEKTRLKEHRRYLKHKSKRLAYSKKYAEAHKKQMLESFKRYRDRHPEIALAHWMAHAIPLRKECEMCGDPAQVRHHPDYHRPLDVMHLCKKCHYKIHMEARWPVA